MASDPVLLGPQLVVAGFSTHVDITRAHEIANEVRRVKKQLKDSQQLATLYNNRERIFNLPVTNVGLLRAPSPHPPPPPAPGLEEEPVGLWPHQHPPARWQEPGIWGAGLNRLLRRDSPPLALRARRLPRANQEALHSLG